MTRVMFVALLVVFISSPITAHADDAVLNAMAERVIKEHIRPAYQTLAVESDKLHTSLKQLCAAPSSKRLFEVKRQFATTVLAFARIEYVRFGPMAEAYRLERFAYWPDRKGRGARAVRLLLKQQNFDGLAPEIFHGKSVAVQGLTALELLLSSSNEEHPLLTSAFSCAYVVAIGDNLARLSKVVLKSWQTQTLLVKQMLTPDKGHQTYRNRQEVLQELYQAMIVGFNNLHSLKITFPVGVEGSRARPKRAAFWRSSLSLPVIKAQYESLKHMVEVSGFLRLLPEVGVDLNAHVREVYTEIEQRLKVLEGLSMMAIVQDEKRLADLRFIAKRLQHLTAGFARNFAIAADLPLGFNASDGD